MDQLPVEDVVEENIFIYDIDVKDRDFVGKLVVEVSAKTRIQ